MFFKQLLESVPFEINTMIYFLSGMITVVLTIKYKRYKNITYISFYYAILVTIAFACTLLEYYVERNCLILYVGIFTVHCFYDWFRDWCHEMLNTDSVTEKFARQFIIYSLLGCMAVIISVEVSPQKITHVYVSEKMYSDIAAQEGSVIRHVIKKYHELLLTPRKYRSTIAENIQIHVDYTGYKGTSINDASEHKDDPYWEPVPPGKIKGCFFVGKIASWQIDLYEKKIQAGNEYIRKFVFQTPTLFNYPLDRFVKIK